MITHIVLAVLACCAMLQDICNRKIKNIFNVSSAVIALITVIVSRDISISDSLLGLLSSAVSGILLWKLGAFKAGDAKFMWTIGIMKGLRAFWMSLAYSMIAGGVIALFIILFKKDFRQRFKRL